MVNLYNNMLAALNLLLPATLAPPDDLQHNWYCHSSSIRHRIGYIAIRMDWDEMCFSPKIT